MVRGRGAGLSGGRQRSATFSGFWERHCVEGLRTGFRLLFFAVYLFWFGTKGFSLRYGARAKVSSWPKFLKSQPIFSICFLKSQTIFSIVSRKMIMENVFLYFFNG